MEHLQLGRDAGQTGAHTSHGLLCTLKTGASCGLCFMHTPPPKTFTCAELYLKASLLNPQIPWTRLAQRQEAESPADSTAGRGSQAGIPLTSAGKERPAAPPAPELPGSAGWGRTCAPPA